MEPSNAPIFSEGEKILCYHGPLIYEAKCLQLRFNETEKINEYYVHYSGWNKSWDEWVPETRAIKYNETNLKRQEELQNAQKESKTRKKSRKSKKKSTSGMEVNVSQGKEGSSSMPDDKTLSKTNASTQIATARKTPRRKRTTEETAFPLPEPYPPGGKMKIKIPDDLKPILARDWNLVNNENRLLKIPASITAKSIINDFKKIESEEITENIARVEIAEGIEGYMNLMLGPQLLYKVEKDQYYELDPDVTCTPPVELYGAVHLLRLFVKLATTVAHTRPDLRTVQVTTSHVIEFLEFLKKNAHIYFSPNDYVDPV